MRSAPLPPVTNRRLTGRAAQSPETGRWESGSTIAPRLRSARYGGASVVLGGNGSDTITVSGAADAAISRVAGGNDADLITLQGTATYSAVGAGAGNDTIEVSGVTTLAAGATLGLGKGDDLLSGVVTISTGAGIIAGAGADTITIDALAGLTGTFVNGDSTVEGGAADSWARAH